jgi:hypothetical protein
LRGCKKILKGRFRWLFPKNLTFLAMRFIDVGPKYIYYLAVIVHFLALAFLAFLLGEAALAKRIDALIALSVFSSIFLFRAIFVISKYIYAKIDTSTDTLIFGSVFFQNEVPLSKVMLIEKTLYMRTILTVKIEGRIYLIYSLTDNVEDSFRLD